MTYGCERNILNKYHLWGINKRSSFSGSMRPYQLVIVFFRRCPSLAIGSLCGEMALSFFLLLSSYLCLTFFLFSFIYMYVYIYISVKVGMKVL